MSQYQLQRQPDAVVSVQKSATGRSFMWLCTLPLSVTLADLTAVDCRAIAAMLTAEAERQEAAAKPA